MITARWIVLAFIAGIYCLITNSAIAGEYTLFDSKGMAVAYIDTDDEMTVYLWKGRPVAYVDDENIYGFNGKHLGWFENAIVWNHDGYAVGFLKGAVNKLTQLEPYKGFKQFKPFKSFQEFAPFKQFYRDQFAAIPLEIFLIGGAK